jgi:ABC-type multidrug transport system fused ATPase/permease subunit
MEHININNLLINSIMKNKSVLIPIIPIFIGFYLQDNVFTSRIGDATADMKSFLNDMDIKSIVNVFSPYVLAVLLFYVSNTISSRAIPNIDMDIIHILSYDIIDHVILSKENVNVSELILHIKKVGEYKNIYRIIMTYVVPTFIITIGLIYEFMSVDKHAGISVIIIILLLIFLTIDLESRNLQDTFKTEESENGLYDELHEIMSNMDTIITSLTKEKELDNIKKKENETYHLSKNADLNNGTATYGLQLISMISVIGINYISYLLYKENKIGIPLFISTILLSLLMIDYYNYCTHAISDLITNIGKYHESVKYFNDFAPYMKSNVVLKDLILTKGDIKFRNIGLKYKDKTIFDKYDMDIQGGSKTALVGTIGSGKSTLLKMLSGLHKYEGHIYVDNQDLSKCTYSSIVKHITYISQHTKLFNKTILYNLSYGTDYKEAEITEKLKELDLLNFYNTFQQGILTNVGKEGSKLSGGQRQVVAITRSIIQNKSIILLDEPTASLDSHTKTIFMNLIQKLKDKTIIIATHDKQIMYMFDETIDVVNQKLI